MVNSGNKRKEIPVHTGVANSDATPGELHPAWQALIRYCREIVYGEIECIKIQDGIPVSVEVITRKIRLC